MESYRVSRPGWAHTQGASPPLLTFICEEPKIMQVWSGSHRCLHWFDPVEPVKQGYEYGQPPRALADLSLCGGMPKKKEFKRQEVLFTMSTKVDLDRLGSALDDYTYAYLITTDEKGYPRAVAVQAELVDGILNIDGCGKRSRANALSQPVVALVYPPDTEGGYSLIVDGEATVGEQGINVAPTVAVLHRPPGQDTPPSATGCTSDCVRLESEI